MLSASASVRIAAFLGTRMHYLFFVRLRSFRVFNRMKRKSTICAMQSSRGFGGQGRTHGGKNVAAMVEDC